MEFSDSEVRVSENGSAGDQFSPGDFVWGKIKNHPWWPGQVHDSCHASELAKSTRRREEQSLLVAYFGDRTFAWCEPSQLKHFSDGFDEMARQSVSKSFVKALKEALDAIQVSWESDTFDRTIENAGIMDGTVMPKGQLKGFKIREKSPEEMLGRIRELACEVSGAELLEITGIRAWFSLFYKATGLRLVHEDRGFGESVEKAEKSSQRKKMRSLADLIAQTDELISPGVKKLDSAGRQQRKKSQVKLSDFENADMEQEDGAASGRRERKRSRYLSPPYITSAPKYLKKDVATAAFEKDGDGSAEGMLHELCRIALDSTYVNGDISSARVRTFFNNFRGNSYALVCNIGENDQEQLLSEPNAYFSASSGCKSEEEGVSGSEEKSISRSNFNLEGESEPTAEFETLDRSPLLSDSKFDTDECRDTRSEKFEVQSRNSDDEAAVQLTLGSGPAGEKHPLEFIKKSLEAMISALRLSFPSESLDSEVREKLICEMNRLLKNVDELLGGSSTFDYA